jgi:hypothetical protein
MDCVPTCPHANFNIWTSQVRCPCCTRNGRLLLFPARAHTRTNYIFVHFYTIPVSLSAKNSCYVPYIEHTVPTVRLRIFFVWKVKIENIPYVVTGRYLTHKLIPTQLKIHYCFVKRTKKWWRRKSL